MRERGRENGSFPVEEKYKKPRGFLGVPSNRDDASICAIIPIFLVFSNEYNLGINLNPKN
jgi:hypothetical protein